MDFKNYVVWGYRNPGRYHTHSHIHYGLFRALQYMGKNVVWLDDRDGADLSGWRNTFFITNHDVSTQLPVDPSNFYMIHGGVDHPVWQRFVHLKNRLSWNVYINTHDPLKQSTSPELVWLDEDMPLFLNTHHMNFRWATDLTPEEIQKNKAGAAPLNKASHDINYVGTRWRVNENELDQFARGCRDGGVTFRMFGAGQASDVHSWNGNSKVVSHDENQSLVRESLFAPAILGTHHLTEGYAPCRIFKNISYGHFGVTNSSEVQRLFGGRLICVNDPYQLFFEARERLASTSQEELFKLMDYVAEYHTYVRRLTSVFRGVEMLVA